MATESESPLDRLWREYSTVFRNWDDLTLARWMAQTLGQIEGRSWRLSHPLIGAYRLASQLAHDRQVWLKRLVKVPAPYLETECCRAPLLPLFTRDILDAGLVCQHCSGTAVTFDDLPVALKVPIQNWAELYSPVHAVAHWDDRQRKQAGNYNQAYENAAAQAETLLSQASAELLPKFLDHYPAIIWEDQDECLEVRPEDIRT